MRKNIYILLAALLVAGCAALETEDKEVFRSDFPFQRVHGVYHKVERGETLWNIAQAYNVPIDAIVRSNNIPNVAKVEVGQLIFIPGIDERKAAVVPKTGSGLNFIWPVRGKVISYFQQRKGSAVNKGIDIEADEGEMVTAARSGQVVLADNMTGYGNTVIIDHHDGFYSVYANNSKLLVKLGDKVFQDAPLAYVGTKNNISYLHFEIRQNSREENPLFYLP